MDAFQTICTRCGRQVAPVNAPAPIPYFYTRVHRHVHTLGILWIAYAAWTLLHWAIAVGFLAGMAGHWGIHPGRGFDGFYSFPFFHMAWFIPLVTAVLVARAVLCLAAGFALLRRAPWARTLMLVTAFLTLIRPVSGTVLAIYTLWVLLPTASANEYEQIAVPHPM
jgi:hypothetical protein